MIDTGSLEDRAAQLRELMHGLECSDDGLFINASGNLAMYQAWERELRGINDTLALARLFDRNGDEANLKG